MNGWVWWRFTRNLSAIVAVEATAYVSIGLWHRWMASLPVAAAALSVVAHVKQRSLDSGLAVPAGIAGEGSGVASIEAVADDHDDEDWR